MSQYREKSRFQRVFTWRRVLVLICFAVILIIIIRTPMEGRRKKEQRALLLEKISGNTNWDKSTVQLFKKQLGLDEPLETKGDLYNCFDMWEENMDYLIVTGFPPEKDDDIESHLWLYFNLLSLEKFDRNSPLRLLLPLKSKQILSKVFENLQFGDLSILTKCNSHVNIDQLLTRARIVGHFDEIAIIEQPSPDPVKSTAQGNIQMVVLNRGAKRLKELADFDFSFVPYRPLFTRELIQRVGPLIGRASNVPADGESGETPVVDTVPLNLIGVHVDQKDNWPELLERLTAAMEYYRSGREDVMFIVLCDAFFKEDCLAEFKSADILVSGFDSTVEERLAVLASCHGNIISNGIGFFGALMSNGDVSLVNFEKSQSSWLLWFAKKREDWVVIERGGIKE